MTITSVSSISTYEEVPPPAPKTVARPTTEGACQVRLHESMLLVPITARANFWAMKFISLVDFEQEKKPHALGPASRLAVRSPSAARWIASSHEAGRNSPPSRTSGSVRRVYGE